MRYRWIEGQTCKDLSAELGIEVLSITRGMIELNDGRVVSGIEVETTKVLDDTQLALLSGKMPPGFKTLEVK